MTIANDRLAGVRAVWRRAVPESVRRRCQPAIRALRWARIQMNLRRRTSAPGPLIVSGMLNNALGIGQAGRLTVRALQEAGFAPFEHDLANLFASTGRTWGLPGATRGGVWLAHCNPPEALEAIERLDPSAWGDRRRIGHWVYELPVAPPSWRPAARFFDEIWTPSQFVADSLIRAGITKPVRTMPHPVAMLHRPAPPDRPRFGIDAAAYCVLSMGDFRSSHTRKNLLGAVDIYCRAFGPADGCQLVLKTLGDGDWRRLGELVTARSGGRDDILILHQTLDDAGVAALIASCDLYLSPHRAEGFGLPLAESFLHGKPVLATGWSGNMEFMHGLTGLLIPFELVPVHDPDGVYLRPGQVWAEPDTGEAAVKLRALRASPELARDLAARGAAAVHAFSQAWSAQALSKTALAGATKS